MKVFRLKRMSKKIIKWLSKIEIKTKQRDRLLKKLELEVDKSNDELENNLEKVLKELEGHRFEN